MEGGREVLREEEGGSEGGWDRRTKREKEVVNEDNSPGCIQDFCQGGTNLEYVRNRGGEAVRSCKAAAGGWGIQGRARITQGGENAPHPP